MEPRIGIRTEAIGLILPVLRKAGWGLAVELCSEAHPVVGPKLRLGMAHQVESRLTVGEAELEGGDWRVRKLPWKGYPLTGGSLLPGADLWPVVAPRSWP